MLSRFFINRPIFAWVIAIVIMLAGFLAIRTLPVAQYPEIAPPSVSVSAFYPGASAQTVQDSVTQIIEQRMTGLDNLLYMSSTSDSSGRVTVTLTFSADTDPDIAQVQVQNKVQQAVTLLPQQVQQQGLTVAKSQSNFLLIVGLYDETGKATNTDLSDYMAANMQDSLSRVPGVGNVQLFGGQYAMRIWLDPAKLNSVSLTPGDVMGAIQAQNTQVSAGELGGAPAVAGQQLNATITAQSRLSTPEQFRAILLKTTPDGARVTLGDVARVELGSEVYQFVSRFNGKPASGIAVQLAAGANALDTADLVKARVAEMSKTFPAGYKYVIPYDSTPFVKLSIDNVVHTLIEAVILVFVVMFVFLQNWRATLIPTIAVPIVLLGTFAVMAAFGFSINTLTMFGLVLAIGLLVDDAIVVVENVERLMAEKGLSPREATIESMREITGALIGIALVLSAVFVPMAFFGGSVGVIYRQFSVTIVSAMALSVVVALVLTPALTSTLLKPHKHGASQRGFFGWFNKNFDKGSHRYQSSVGRILKQGVRYGAVYGVIVLIMVFLFIRLPSAFLPEEDQGLMFTLIQAPAGATQERTLGTVKQVESYFQSQEDVQSLFSVVGFSFAGQGQNNGMAFVRLKDWDERKGKDHTASAVAGRAMGALAGLRDAMVFTLVPPAIPALGQSSGFEVQLQDVGGIGHEALIAARNQLLGMAATDPNLAGVRPNGQEDTPQFQIDIDQQKAAALGVTTADINSALSIAWAGAYVNDFIDRGRVKRVYLQGEASSRMNPDDLNQWYVRNASGGMVPFSAFATGKWTYGPPRLERFNGVPSVNIQGGAAPGKSTGDAMRAIEQIAAKLPPGTALAWSGLSYQERASGAQAPALYAISIIVVFLCLAALYESWSIPFSVMLVLPLGIIGALAAASLRGLANDIYFQVGLLTTIGLSAKNAILIVEFAKDLQAQGRSLIDATLEAARLRLRPILMTSLAFVFGVLPLAISTGAGSGAQNAIGVAVIGGMITATVLAIFFVPLFFVIVRRLFKEHGDEGAPPAVSSNTAVEDR